MPSHSTSEYLQLIVIVGGSSTGKTRAAYEAVKQLPSGWRLHYPMYPDKPQALVDSLKSGKIAPRTVVWLNELQQYLLPVGGEEAAAALREYLQGNDDVVFIGTIWPDYWQELTQAPTGLEDSHSQARALLLFGAKRIEMHSQFPSHRLNSLADQDARIRMALQRGEGHITQYIAAGPALVEYYLDAKATAPPVWAILSAAMDYCLIDSYGKASSDISSEFLEAAALGYMSDEERGILREDWLVGSLQRASVLLRGATRPLAAVRSRKADFATVRFRLADYLLQYARQYRFKAPMPASFWDGISADLDTVYVPAFAEAAQDRGMYQQSAELWSAEAQEGNPRALAALLTNPQVDRKAAERTAIEAIQNVDMDDTYIIGWMLVELREYPDIYNRLVEKIVAHVQELGVRGSEPLEMSIILRELIENSGYEAASIYVHRIHGMIADVDLSDFWSAESLAEELLGSGLEDGRRAGLALADSLYNRYKTDSGKLASLLRVVASENSNIYDEGIRELRLLVNSLQDVSDVISITPLLYNLRGLSETEAYEKLLERVCGSISTLTLGSSYAPFEMISLLREEGLDCAADKLSARVSEEYDPVISGATAHALEYLRPLMTSNVFEAFAVRMAMQGPILPIAEAEEVAEFFAGMQNPVLRQAYLQRVQRFRAAEGN